MTESPDFACDIAAIPADRRVTYHALAKRLTTEIAVEIRDVPDGLTFAFRADAYDDVMQFVAFERLCCPFLQFSIDMSPHRGPISLTLIGPPGTAAFIRAELGLPGA